MNLYDTASTSRSLSLATQDALRILEKASRRLNDWGVVYDTKRKVVQPITNRLARACGYLICTDR